MIRKLRSLAMLLALPLFLAVTAEQARAATCLDTGASDPSPAGMLADAGGAGGHAGMSMPPPTDPGGSPSGEEECPAMALAAGCALVALSAPAAQPDLGNAPTSAAVPAGRDHSLSLLLASSLFRPPQR